MDEIVRMIGENSKLREILNKIDKQELKIFVTSDGRMVTNEFRENMKELHDILSN